MKTTGFVIVASLILAGCGGGGGGGGASVVAEWLGTDPNAVITTKTGVSYDLTHGTPDATGQQTVDLIFGPNGTNQKFTFPSAGTLWGHTLSGQDSPTSGPTISVPSAEVKAAWSQGWTGLDQNVLMIDMYPDPVNKPSWLTDKEYRDAYVHGITTSLLAGRYATSANFYAVDGNNNYDGLVHDSETNGVATFADNRDNNHIALKTSVRAAPGFYMDVTNISLGYNYWQRNIYNPTQAQVDDAFSYQATWTSRIASFLNGTDVNGFGTPGSSPLRMTDAVVTKAAGNDSIDTKKDPLSYVLAHDTSIAPRLLVVGALDTNGKATYVGQPGTATIANYSNVAGTDINIQSHFLVASGHTPYDSTGLAIDGVNVPAGKGTSYAAPRVAGYAAILRQKFPNLTAANTADILLQTARYDTLTCNPNCNKAIYGQGEASLSHALSPVGALR